MFNKSYFLIRWIIIAFHYYELLLKTVLFRPQYILTGKCRQCAQCCEQIGVHDPKNIFKHSFLGKMVINYYQKINDFQFLGYISEQRMFIFSCKHFDQDQKKCLNYRHRPAICRGYPLVRYFDKPEIMPGCGYQTELRKAHCPDK